MKNKDDSVRRVHRAYTMPINDTAPRELLQTRSSRTSIRLEVIEQAVASLAKDEVQQRSHYWKYPDQYDPQQLLSGA